MSRAGVQKEKEYPCRGCGKVVIGKNSRKRCSLCVAASKELTKQKTKIRLSEDPEYIAIRYAYHKKWKQGEKGQKWYKDNKSRIKQDQRVRQLANHYNLTLDDYTQLLKKFNNACALPHCKSTTDLVIDHDHSCCPTARTCGKCIRGVLCRQCNVAIGKLGDTLQSLLSVVNYLDSIKTKEDEILYGIGSSH